MTGISSCRAVKRSERRFCLVAHTDGVLAVVGAERAGHEEDAHRSGLAALLAQALGRA